MATKPLTTEAIAQAEKKMDMTLDDIIKMSKTNAAKPKKQGISNKSRRSYSESQDKTQKMRQYMNSRSTLRQGVLAQKRFNFPGNGFPLAYEAAARKAAAVAPFHSRAFNRNRATNWNKPRPGGPLKKQGNLSNGGNAYKPRKTGEASRNLRPKTLDSLFANMKEQRMKSFTSTKNAAASNQRSGFDVRNQVRQPWLRRRFGY